MKKKEHSKWELEADPVWVTTDNTIKPSAYFLKWWQDISTKRYGDDSHWLDIAFELGYMSKEIDSKSGVTFYEPVGFDYDPQLVRNTLGISPDMPSVRYKETGQDQYQRMLDKLFNTDGDNHAY